MESNGVSQNFVNPASQPQPHQQNGSEPYAVQYNFQGSNLIPVQVATPGDHQQQQPPTMNNPEVSQPPNTNTFYWNEFAAPNATINWGYYTNYTLPQPQIAMPVVEFPAQNQDNANQNPVTTPSNFNFQTGNPAIPDSNNTYQTPSFFPKEIHFSESQVIPVQQARTYQFHELPLQSAGQPQSSQAVNIVTNFQFDPSQNHNGNLVQGGQAQHPIPQNQNNIIEQSIKSEDDHAIGNSSRRTSTVSMQDCQDSTSSGDLPSNSSGNSKSGAKSECDMCNKVFCNSTSLKRHKRLVHKIDQPSQSRQMGKTTDFMCDRCGKYFCNRCSLQRHKSTVADCHKRVASNDNNDNSVKDDSDEMTQESIISNEKNASYALNTSTVDLSQLNDFKYEPPKNGKEGPGSSGKQKTESCHICGKGFTTKGALYRHMKNIHNKYKSEENSNSEIADSSTQELNQTFPTSEDIQSAINNAKDSFSDIFKLSDGSTAMQNSSDSNVKANQSSNLQSNSAFSVKTKEKKCPTCGKILANSKSLRRHQLVSHQIKSEPIPSNKSGPTSNNSSSGSNDSETCDICHKVISKSNMRRHKIFVHKIKFSNSSDEDKKDAKVPAQRKRPCVYCARLISWGNLLRHQRTNHKFELERDQKLAGGNYNRAIVNKQEPKDNFEDLIKIDGFQPNNFDERQNANTPEPSPVQPQQPQPQPPEIQLQPNYHEQQQQQPQNAWLEPPHTIVQSEIHHDFHGLQATWVQASSINEMDTLESLVYKTLEGSNTDMHSDQFQVDSGLKSELLTVPSDVRQDFSQAAWMQPNAIQPVESMNYANLGQPSTDVPTSEFKGDTVMQTETSECPICEKMVLTTELKDHKNNHELVCHICGREDICLKDVSSHGATHVADLVCEVCGYKAQAKVKLWEHMNQHMGVKPLVCLECGWSFGNSGSVQYHMKQYHSTIDELAKCGHCDRVFPTEQAKRGHEVSHYGTTCPFCHQEFERKKDLALHIKTHYSRKKQD